MFALVCVYPSGKRDLMGFVNSAQEAEEYIDKICEQNGGREYLTECGVRFNVELAI